MLLLKLDLRDQADDEKGVSAGVERGVQAGDERGVILCVDTYHQQVKDTDKLISQFKVSIKVSSC